MLILKLLMTMMMFLEMARVALYAVVDVVMFLHQVSLSFDQNSTTPSQNVSLTVNASQGSFVGILAVDQSALLLKQGNDITQDMVGPYKYISNNNR